MGFDITDILIAFFLLSFLIHGWRKGFFKSALPPAVFSFCSVLGIIYFDITQNFVKAVMLTTLASTVITTFILFLFWLSRNSVDSHYRNYKSLVSCLLGSVINLFWQGCLLLVMTLLITLAPLKIYGFAEIQNNIQQSFAYSFIVKNVFGRIPAVPRIITTFSVFEDPDKMQMLSSTEEFRQFFLNEKIQSLLADETFMENVKRRDIPKIMIEPKILDIVGDDDLMESFSRLAKKIYSLNLP